ncbi:MAG TPA: DUF4412 domain-containing protein [Longimicrobiales bacterium]|nr:DUF4412 domain-containing protein [Longimicrobiales bacterium]
MRMIRTVSAFAAASLLAPASLNAQQVFEGTVAYSVQMNATSLNIVHHVKGDRTRQEVSGMPGMPEMVVLMDMGEMELHMIMPSQNAYMTMDVSQVAAMVGVQHTENPTIERTGQMETVAGHQCENVNITAEGTTMTMCAATDLGFYFMGGGGGGGRMGGPPGMNPELEAKIREVFEDGFFPLKMTATQNGQSVTLVATSIEQKSLADDLFVVPAGYTKMPGMGGG